MTDQNTPILFYDGVCNLCTGVVQFVLKKDQKKTLEFASLQSENGQNILRKFNLPVRKLGTFIWYENGIAFTKSAGVHKLFQYLGGRYKWFSLLKIIPFFIQDLVYDVVAKTRYSIFGKKDSCIYSLGEYDDRFLQ
jgi:predicted DCC family thiol-disulfide oxidoreductase YuxK